MSETIAVSGPFKLPVAVGTAVSRHKLLKIDANGEASHAGLTDKVIGISRTEMPAAAADRTQDGNLISVVPINYAGSVRMVAAGAIAIGADLFKAADGEVDDTGTATHEIGWVNISKNITAADQIIQAIPRSRNVTD